MQFPKKLPGEDFIHSWYPIVIALVIGLIFGIRNYFKGNQCSSRESMKGKTVVVTGASRGIGKEITKDLAQRGARVVMACHDEEHGKETVEDLHKIYKVNKDNLVVMPLDLASFKSVHEFAEKLIKNEEKINGLINNAGVMCAPETKTEDGNELHMQVNFLGPALLTHLLLDKLKSSAPSRIINNTAPAYKLAELDVEDLNSENKEFNAGDSYANSKLCNLLYTRQLAKELEGSNVTCNVVHPGIANTDIYRNMPFRQSKFISFTMAPFIWFLMKTAKDGAQGAIYCSVAKEEEGVSGKFYSECFIKEPDEMGKDDELAKRLWDVTQELILPEGHEVKDK